MNHIFQAGGALLADSTVYIKRKADREALAHLSNMAYLLIIEPRQQDKTFFGRFVFGLMRVDCRRLGA